MELICKTENQTEKAGATLATQLFTERRSHARGSVFVQLEGPLGAGKTVFARGFMRAWMSLAGETVPATFVSPTYNLVKTYGSELAHFDLYRLESKEELDQVDYEAYFYEYPCCLVEWLSRIPEGEALMPPGATRVFLSRDSTHSGVRRLKIIFGKSV